jgi:lipid-A-disaccharide synthase
MKYYIIAGEASGDLHGANLIKALHRLDDEAEVRAWGGELMIAAGAEVVKHYRDLAFMGFLEVAMNLRTIKKNFDYCKKDILKFNPDTVIFVDYPGFNLRMAKWAKENKFRTQYYISPTIWAWNTGRVHKVKAYVDQMFTILPFENKFYEKYDYPAQYVGHPLLDAVEQSNFQNISKATGKKTVALLPGSRKQELDKILPVVAEVVKQSPQYHFILAAVPWLDKSIYEQHFGQAAANLQIEINKTYDVLASADMGIITSGTATLETALFNVPQVVIYKTSFITYTLAKRFAKVKHISLPNLILEEGLVEELIQEDCTPDQLLTSLKALESPERATIIKDGYQRLHAKLGDAGASQRVAQAIYEDVKRNVG